jgi:hypothetical protein
MTAGGDVYILLGVEGDNFSRMHKDRLHMVRLLISEINSRAYEKSMSLKMPVIVKGEAGRLKPTA